MKPDPKARIEPLKKGDKRIGSRAFHNALVATCNAVRTLKVKTGSKNDFVISDDNAELTIKGTGDDSGTGQGWHWAKTKEYDFTTGYSIDEVVVVSPDNPSIALEGAVAGLYVSLRSDNSANAPVWPPPNDSPDHESNFWWLIALYPSVLTVCQGGIDTDYFVNAQPVPT